MSRAERTILQMLFTFGLGMLALSFWMMANLQEPTGSMPFTTTLAMGMRDTDESNH